MISIGIVGAGGIARRHFEALQGLENVRIAAVVDVVPEKAAAMADACGATPYGDIRECFADVEAVYILTPPSFHKDLALAAIAAGKHVFIEKPIASTLEDAEAIVAAAADARVKLMVAFNMRFRKGFRRLKEIVDSGQLGDIVSIWSQRLGVGVGDGINWRTTPELLCGMSVESLSHDIDLIQWIAGDIADVRASVYESRPSLPGFDDNASVVCSLRNGGSAVIHASWSSHLSANSRGVVGTHGTAMLTGSGLWDLTNLHIKTEDMEHEVIEVLNDRLDLTSYREESRHFTDAIAQDGPVPVSGDDALRALRVSHAILTSHREQRVVTLSA